MRRHRAADRLADRVPPSAVERRLIRVQQALTRAVAESERLAQERDALALQLWMDQRVPQAHITAALDAADRGAGGPGVSQAAVQRRLHRLRESNGDVA